jgi:hypothetical protein
MKRAEVCCFSAGITLDVSSSLGSAGRIFLASWMLISTSPPLTISSTLALKSYLNISFAAVIVIPNLLLPAGTLYTFGASLTNWLGSRSVTNITVSKSQQPLLPIAFSAPAFQYVTRADTIMVQASTISQIGSSCFNTSTIGKTHYVIL